MLYNAVLVSAVQRCESALSIHIISSLFFIFKFIFNWRIIGLQCHVGFCHTSIRISQRYTYVPSLLNLPYTYPLPATLSHHGALS